ncbi:MinD superfamily P-loop ATPase, contains an inserted ferredoxin domain [Desulfotomaculum arcticum]|uniref:MinD superfamily P-loop ATPase, contains an inserted ferredoxin domain n=1 Tax=Desulfotruncus arcticus DSM 17038 TaxID=1121424 RepID=A0A1I2V1C2_9FIRM|nr:ATP-binding protein [Desulfotruncus arcticus]SFG81957.1 MinD superfamily P-loop ATPase, contains an inserted ferredoxin domain [Desulfotomaculum arcticum] [Desulfotruncus arcticus DSM 17038]
MIISVASGKGGTGKTTVAVGMALALQSIDNQVTFLDCDVEEPNGHIFIKPDMQKNEDVYIQVPEINREKCDYCGKCAELCAFNALLVASESVVVFHELCHGCGGCNYFCPQGAVNLIPKKIGTIEVGSAAEGLNFAHGMLEIGVPLSPPLVDAVKKKQDGGVTIIDAPPGTSCPAVHTVRGTDFCLLVTEPTPFGLNDLALAVEMARALGVPCGVLVNRAREGWDIIDKYCQHNGISILMKIPLSREIAGAYSRGIPLTFLDKEWEDAFRRLFRDIRGMVESERDNCH